MNQVAAMIMCRLSSRRVSRKALIEIGGKRMIDRGCNQLRRVCDAAGIVGHVACWPGDFEIIDACESAGLVHVSMTEEQSRSDDWSFYSEAFKKIDSFWIVNVAMASMPFVRDEVYLAAIENAKRAIWPFQLCVKNKRPIWDSGTRLLLMNVEKPLSTLFSPEWLTTAYIATGFNRYDCGVNGRMNLSEPWVPEIKLRPEELLDSDTQEEIDFLNLVADGLWVKQRDEAFAVASQGYGA